MNFLERKDINVEKWNQLVGNTNGASFFSYAWYLDATAENWSVLVTDDYTSGIALPYTIRMGERILYSPIFVRYIEPLGSSVNLEKLQKEIEAHFKNYDIAFSIPLLGDHYEDYVFQKLKEDRKIGSQAKRMLKKAEKNDLTIQESNDFDVVLDIIHQELKGKHQGINETSMKAMNQLFLNAKKAGVLKAYILEGHGGVVALEDENKILYLKGTTDDETKNIGGMYLLINHLIEMSVNRTKVFDFGGSKAPGVRKFNQNLGGNDVHYFYYKLDNGPFWFKFARRIKDLWKK